LKNTTNQRVEVDAIGISTLAPDSLPLKEKKVRSCSRWGSTIPCWRDYDRDYDKNYKDDDDGDGGGDDKKGKDDDDDDHDHDHDHDDDVENISSHFSRSFFSEPWIGKEPKSTKNNISHHPSDQ
jgi:ABC-type Zn2+ transport system substrate-binding protein/surface adhesin